VREHRGVVQLGCTPEGYGTAADFLAADPIPYLFEDQATVYARKQRVVRRW
jgi:hypothetical protein